MKQINFLVFLITLCSVSLCTNAQYVPPTHVEGAAPNGILWDSVLTGRTLPVRTTTVGFNGAPGAVMFYDKATGKFGINPNGLSLSAVIVTYTSGFTNITAATPGPFIYSGNTGTNAWSPATGTPRIFPAVQAVTGLAPTTFVSRFGAIIGNPLGAFLATTGDVNNIASTDGYLNLPWSFGKVVNIDSLITNNKVLADSNFKVVGQNSNLNANLLGYGPVGTNSPVKGCFQYSANGIVGNQVGPIVFYSSIPTCTAPTLSSSITHQSCSNLNDGAIDLTATGGSPSPVFDWEGPNGFYSRAEDISNLAPGTYLVFATSGSCRDSASYTVNAGNPAQAVSVSIASNASGNTICAGTSVTFTATPTNEGTSPGYQWKLNGNNVGSNSSTFTTSSLSNNDVVTVEMTSNAVCAIGSPATSNSITTTVNTNQTASVSIASNAAGNTICAGTSVTFTATPTNGGASPSYQWKKNGTNVGTNSNTYTTTSLVNSDAVTVVMTSNAVCATGSPATSNIINTVVNQPSSSSVTESSTGNYTWNGQTYTSSGTYTWTGTNAVGCDSIATLNLTINVVLTNNIANVCPYIGTNQTLTYTAAVSGASSYNWVLPANTQLISGQGTRSVEIKILNGFANIANKQLKVTPAGGSQQIIYLLAQAPITPSPIQSSGGNICNIIGTSTAITYTVPKAYAAASYIWTAQNGTTIITSLNGAGTNDTAVAITFASNFTSSNITVQSVNDCGVSGSRSLMISRNTPSQPGLISGPVNACEFLGENGQTATYAVSAVPNVDSYNWTLPNGAFAITGQGTRNISFKYPANFTSGTITVTVTSGCGTSSARSLNITRLQAGTPSVIDVINTGGCPNRTYTYTLAAMPSNTTSVSWTIPTGGTIVSGQGSTSITVSYNSGLISGEVKARAVNNCSVSGERETKVKLPACPPSGFASNKGAINQTNGSMRVQLFPNPTASSFNLQVLSADSKEVGVRIMDVQGRFIKSLTIAPFQTVNIGNELKAGVYMVEAKQGNIVKTTRVVKY